jgi:hypothetical protein
MGRSLDLARHVVWSLSLSSARKAPCPCVVVPRHLQVLERRRLGLPYGTDRGPREHVARSGHVLPHGDDLAAEQGQEGDRLLGHEVDALPEPQAFGFQGGHRRHGRGGGGADEAVDAPRQEAGQGGLDRGAGLVAGDAGHELHLGPRLGHGRGSARHHVLA